MSDNKITVKMTWQLYKMGLFETIVIKMSSVRKNADDLAESYRELL